MSIKILFIGVHRPERSPSQRFRFEQYMGHLNRNGFDCDQQWMISSEDDRFFYKSGNILKKGMVMLKGAFKNLRVALSAGQYDIIFVQREAHVLGTTIFEKFFSRSKAKLVFDFDDAIFLQNISGANKKFSFLKDPGKTAKIIKLSDMVFAGNSYLAEFAGKYNSNVKIVPTTIDTEAAKKYIRKDRRDQVCVGWTGSLTTIRHFETALPFLRRIKEKYGGRVYFKVIGDAEYINKELGIEGVAWKKETELEDLSEIDIGIMPLPDDEWAKGKCGLKGLQYMALAIPTIMSPVGVNTEIIEDGENGYLAADEDEWVDKISKLIENPELRSRLGEAGRKTVVENYSILAQRDNYIRYLNEVMQS